MNNTLLVFIGLLLMAMFSLGVATLFNLEASVVYIVSLLCWFIGTQIYYRKKDELQKY